MTGSPVTRPSIFARAGGGVAFLRLAAAHHARCLADPVLSHPFSHALRPDHVERLAAYWSEIFGGPANYSAAFGDQSSVLALHAGSGAEDALAGRFVGCFVGAMDDAGLPEDPELRRALAAYIAWATSDVHGYSPPGSSVPLQLAVPAGAGTGSSRRPDWPSSRASARVAGPWQDRGVVRDIEDPRRVEPAFVSDERTMLEGWLEFHRTTLLLKCEGLDAAALAARPVASSKLSLHGLVRHMTDVERNWFTRVLERRPDAEPVFFDPAVEDSELVPLDDAVWTEDLRRWQAECERSRTAAARFDLDHLGSRRGADCSLRWIYNHMIEEYARHNGHADLLRELIDESVGS